MCQIVTLWHISYSWFWHKFQCPFLLQVSRLKSREHLFTDKSLWEVSRILKIFLTRISKEAQRFSRKFNICTRNEVYSATQVIFSKTVSRACIGSAYQAYYLYLHSFRKTNERHLTISKSERSGLTISVGKIFRWMIRNRIAPHVTDSGAVYLTAVLEYLVDEICYLSDQRLSKYSLMKIIFYVTNDMMEKGVKSAQYIE